MSKIKRTLIMTRGEVIIADVEKEEFIHDTILLHGRCTEKDFLKKVANCHSVKKLGEVKVTAWMDLYDFLTIAEENDNLEIIEI